MSERRKRTHISAIKRAAALRELAELGCSQIRASALMGCHRQIVNRICKAHGISMPSAIDHTARREAVQALIDIKASRVRMAQTLGVSKSRVSSMLKEYGIAYSNNAGRPNSSLTKRRVAALREFADLGLSQIQSAIFLDIEPCSVSHLCKRFSIAMKGKPGKPPILTNKIIRDFGKEGMSVSAMAARYGTSANTVSGTIHRLRKEGKLPPIALA